MTPDPQRLQQIEDLYHSAREVDAGDREAFLLASCPGDGALRQEVASLLVQDDSSGLLERPVWEVAAPILDDTSDTDWQPGTLVGPYEILGRIGSGGMGAVYKALDTRLNRTVAIKVVYGEFISLSLSEARATAALNHPNIATLYDVDARYLVMELVEGETLAACLKRGPLGLEQACRYGAQMADALSAAHAKGIVHRDLKPRNIMLTKAGVKVLDFGVAQLPGLPAPQMGTREYMAPEQREGRPCDARTDIYSLGLILREMAGGASGHPEFDHIVDRCLAQDPDDRWQTARDLKLELDHAARQTAAPAARPKHRILWWPAAAVVCLVLGGVALSYLWHTPADVRVLPLTSFPGSETSPSFSPDGGQIAFAWNGEKEENFDIYVKQVGPGDPVRLTRDPADETACRWSPDGKWLAFLRRQAPDTDGVYVIPALGGQERKVGEAYRATPGGDTLDWSPDGQFLLVSHRDGLAALSLDSGESSLLTRPPAPRTDFAARFTPDGGAVVFLRSGIGVMLMPVAKNRPAGDARRLPVDTGEPIRGFTWDAGGKDLILSAGLWDNSALWRFPLSGVTPARRMPFGREAAVSPEVARRGNRLAYAHFDSEWNIWSVDLDASGRAGPPPQKVLDSTKNDLSPAFSPDGQRVAFQSSRSGHDEIWVCAVNGTNCTQLTEFRGPHAGSPAWSPGGEWLAFDISRQDGWEIQVMPSGGGKPRHLAWGLMPTWSHDGRFIYFQSSNNGPMYRVAAEGGSVVPLGNGSAPQESPDGRWLYYFQRPADGGPRRLMRRSLPDGGVTEVVNIDANYRNVALVPDGIWFFTPSTREASTLCFFDFATQSVRTVVKTTRPVYAGMAVSHDQRRILFTQVDRAPNLDLLLVEPFK